MLVARQAISFLTFPGTVVHEAAHVYFCKLCNLPILDVRYIAMGNFDTGYVLHAETDNFTSIFLITFGPFLLSSLLCFLVCLPAYLPFSFFDAGQPLSYVLVYLGVAIGMHAIPPHSESHQVWAKALSEVKRGHILAILSLPFLILFYFINLLRIVFAHTFYGVAIGLGIPMLIWG